MCGFFLLSKLFGNDRFTSAHPQRVLMLGLDAAGKTTATYALTLGEPVDRVPTVGFNCEFVDWRSFKFFVWDVGGGESIRPWRRHYRDAHALIWVVDSSDRERIDESQRQLLKLLGEIGGELPLLVFANKQDRPDALSAAEVAGALGLRQIHGRPWHCQASCAMSGDGLHDGLDWLSKH